MPVPTPDAPLSRIPFTAQDESSIKALCNWMQLAAWFTILSAVSKGLAAFVPRQNFGHLVDAVISFLIGLWIYQAATAFRKVTTTDTADQRYVMEGFALMRRVFLLQAILVIIALTSLLLILVVSLLVVATRTGR
jgi:hypothetical protein